ncbi:hypothetical protein [Halorussus sp. MSC15.2]|uniref:hypothetical protein n=1 Tax=Halorussus sp. MSC15.2 TaxID=2283638 RepID=UPI001967892C|nr:hypothetical protein [Halorussus sp. MSC15.2]
MFGLTDSFRRGVAFLVVGMVVLVAAFGASWALAPDTETVSGAADATTRRYWWACRDRDRTGT